MESSKAYSYKDLIVWQKAMTLVVEIYELTKCFPKEEMYGITSQIRRSAVSIPSNISEGKYRSSKKDFKRFLEISYGSGAELETQIEIAKNVFKKEGFDYLKVEEFLLEVMKMLNKMITSIRINISQLTNILIT